VPVFFAAVAAFLGGIAAVWLDGIEDEDSAIQTIPLM
jgi:hypothetical protein